MIGFHCIHAMQQAYQNRSRSANDRDLNNMSCYIYNDECHTVHLF